MNLQVANRPAIRRTALAIALSMGFTGLAFAQATTGSIFGDAPAAQGETVLIQNNTGFSREVAVDASGHFVANQLPLGEYTVTLRQNGQDVDSRKNVTLRVGAGTQVSFAAAGSADAQNLSAITVSANALPTIDVTGVDSRTVITAQQLAQLPLARSAESIALLAPGVVEGSGYFASNATGNTLVSFAGASVSENAYYINGMNVTDPLQGLGGITLPYGSIEQQEILTGGYGAAYGRSDGGVINQIGKRGTNEWHFGAQVQWTPKSLRSDPDNWYFPEDGSLYRYRKDNKSTVTTVSAYAGGPLIQDKLFMFASVEGEKTTGDNVAAASSGTMTTQTFHDPKWYAKLDWNITDNHILELTGASTKHEYNGNVYAYDSDTATRGEYLNTDTHTKTAAEMWIAKYTGYITDDLVISAQYGEQKTDLYTELSDFDPSLIYIAGATRQNPAYAPTGGIRNTQTVATSIDPAHQTKGTNYRFDVTYTLGDHTITAGIDNQRTQDLNDGTYIPADAGYLWQYGKAQSDTERLEAGQVDATGTYPGGAGGYYVAQYRYRTGGSVEVKQRAQYIEDSWQINDRWLVKLGLRNDQFTNYNSEGDAYLTQTKPQWAPRLGFSWDVNGDSSFKVYGNAGRYYLALPTSVALRGASASLYTRVYYTYTGIDPNTGYPTGLTPMNTVNGPGAQISSNNEYGQAPDPNTVTAKSLTAQYQDEYILGFDKQLNDAWTYGAKATYRSLKNAIDDTCNYQLFFDAADAQGLDTSGLRGCYFFNPGRGATFQLPDGNGGYGQLTLTSDQLGYQHAKRDYYALTLYLDHPFDGTWWGRVDYTFSRSYGNTEGQVKSDIGQDDIGATQDWDYPSLMEYANGRLSNDRTHQLKIYGGYQLTPEWNVSGQLTVMSGSPTSCLGAYGTDGSYPAYQGDYYHWCGGVPAPAGSAGDLSWQKRLSLGVEYRPSFADKKLAFSMNVFNVFNEQKQTMVLPDYNSGAYRLTQGMSQPRYVRFGVSYDY
ncbi:TonB-dependent receptor [Frateuria soli]|uniref:TonB-dependent receptor n=1 Tax=Frateuria soli TaxID=1542730 RepID=UPI001E6086DA|nr:TonB-dependent receptor [Frateuria soli]UGB37948.1 TonB-dependent receptor [Frateuria soli]